ncbi:MAG: hypothetical protein ACYC9X_00650 [Dehalococcoidia bacterium]
MKVDNIAPQTFAEWVLVAGAAAALRFPVCIAIVVSASLLVALERWLVRRDAIAALREDFEQKQHEMETAITALGALLKRLEQELAQTRIAAGRR